MQSLFCLLGFRRHFLSLAITAPVPAAWQGASDPVKVFDRTANLEGTQIINYRVDPEEKWCVLIGIAPGAPER